MSKKTFIQSVVIRSLPPLNKIADAVTYAETVYEKLTQLGYGAPKQAKARETINYYKKLTVYQKEGFDKFWSAFAHPHGKQRAAWAWIKLGELTSAEYKSIVIAAKAEAMRPLKPHQSRKMAEGWLSEYRFDDHIADQRKHKTDETLSQKRLLKSELNQLKLFIKQDPDSVTIHQPRIDMINTALAELEARS